MAEPAHAEEPQEEASELAPRIDVQRYGALGGLELWSMFNWFRGGCYSAPLMWISAPTSHAVQSISIRVDGVLQSCGAAGAMMADANDICVVQRIAGQLPAHEDRSFFSLAIPAELLEPELRQAFQRRFRTRVTDDPRPGELLRRLGTALQDGEGNRLRCEELLAELTRAALPEQLPDERSCSVRIERARDFIHARWSESFSLDELSQAVGLTKWHLTRTFTAATGARPSDYARVVRARNALAQLQRGTPLAHVALYAGYADQAHMSREIRRIFGFTPGAYRRASKHT